MGPAVLAGKAREAGCGAVPQALLAPTCGCWGLKAGCRRRMGGAVGQHLSTSALRADSSSIFEGSWVMFCARRIALKCIGLTALASRGGWVAVAPFRLQARGVARSRGEGHDEIVGGIPTP